MINHDDLQPTRTIGDFDVKAKVPKGVISIVPETRVIDILAEGRKKDKEAHEVQGLLVQGTDGMMLMSTSTDPSLFKERVVLTT